jgi:hypothetical protein
MASFGVRIEVSMNKPGFNSGGHAPVPTNTLHAIAKGLNMNNPECNSGGPWSFAGEVLNSFGVVAAHAYLYV